jgi:ABC-type oligopeptide transport system ATPase subunit
MILEVKNLSKQYSCGFFGLNKINAVNDVSFYIDDGEIFGLIGESGCGKTTITRMIMGLLKPTKGNIIFENENITRLNTKQWRPFRKKIQIVFQNPQMTFNPRRNLYFSCAEPIKIHGLSKDMNEKAMIRHMIERVGITEEQLKKFPHEISGGQAQRLSIARALSLKPRLLVCDEPTSMLDVSVQAHILKLIKEANEKYGVSMLFISHDLEVIQAMCSRIAVMKNGQIIETGYTNEIFNNPKHEYTKKLLSSYIKI